MSDIPVGSPPAPPGRHAAPGGWYPDPLDAGRERYWDGWQWSRNTRETEGLTATRQPGVDQSYTGAYGAAPVAPYLGAPGQQTSRQAVTTADGVPLAGWWWRALAGLVDALLTGVVGLLLSLPVYRDLLVAVRDYARAAYRASLSGLAPPVAPDLPATVSGNDYLLLFLIALAVGFAYQVPFLRARGATPGMRLCSLRVVPLDEARSATPLSWRCIWVRSVLWVVPWALNSWLLLLFTLVDACYPLIQPKRQTLHDVAARTQVVKLR